MAQVEVLLPKMGESVAEATIIKWLKEEGDSVEAEESIIEIATDKVDSEVPSPADGVILKRLVDEGDVVKVGEVIAIIGSEGDTVEAKAPVTSTESKEPIAEPVSSNGVETPVAQSNTTVITKKRRLRDVSTVHLFVTLPKQRVLKWLNWSKYPDLVKMEG